MSAVVEPRDLERANASAPFNAWAGFTIEELTPGRCVLSLEWRPEFAQYSGRLHAGLTSALLETCCGFAAATAFGPNLVSQLSVSYVDAAVGERFVSEAWLVRAGRRQAFAEARLVADAKLAAIATAILLSVTPTA
jgi:uncharacterized protein (TIGR00369 family)